MSKTCDKLLKIIRPQVEECLTEISLAPEFSFDLVERLE
jgi:hypothetical protein